MTPGFAVLDLETTGLFPGGHDRIVEIAVVVLDPDGNVVDEYVTLVNPERDSGPTSLHGLTASELRLAPTFRQVTGSVLRRLRGRVIVGHNISFDLRFLASEFGRLGLNLPVVSAVCTLQFVRRLEPDLPSHRLANCCAAYGISHTDAHSAMADARASAELLRVLRELDPCAIPRDLLDEAHAALIDWPDTQEESAPLIRAEARRRIADRPSAIRELLLRLPLGAESAEAAGYQELLERVLEDRRVSESEVTALETLARECGLSGPALQAVHEKYLRGLAGIVIADGVITESERKELDETAQLLGFDVGAVDSILEQAESSQAHGPTVSCRGASEEGPLRDQSVCFTGELHGTVNGRPITRETAQMMATNAGLVVAKGVTKRLGILVVADPDSQSTKARKAKDYGTRVMAESVFWRTIRAPVDGVDALGRKP